MRGTAQWMARGWHRGLRRATAVEPVEVKIIPLRERVHSMVIEPALDEAADPSQVQMPRRGDHSVA